MKYKLSIPNPSQQFIHFNVSIYFKEGIQKINIPTWRPGRYQEADFAKYIKSFKIFAEDGKPLSFSKTSKSTWEVEIDKPQKIEVSYKFYASIMNAGSTYLSEKQLYVNPVNCFIYTENNYDSFHEVELNIPDDWKIANPLKTTQKVFTARNFDELADSPFICSKDLQYNSYEVDDYTFHIWFNGIVKPDWKKVLRDFKAFTKEQLNRFKEFPTKDYHFLFQILPYKTYHGVEHEKCTVITVGPSYAVFSSLYTEFLGVSSHELYHTWNVKAIRPAEWYPYDFSKPNFSKLGYIAEGVTTYMGDLFLYKSKVFDEKQYFIELSAQLQKHFDNFGRFNYSVAESSWDTWLDGYEAGIPGRKVSIYTEGCLLAFALDILILKSTDLNKDLSDVMRSLYFDFAQKNKGVTEDDFLNSINNVAGKDFSWFFEQYYNGTKAYETLLIELFEDLGMKIISKPSSDFAASYLGVKTIPNQNGQQVKVIYPGSGLDLGGLTIDDIIIGINGISINNDLSQWVEYFKDDQVNLDVISHDGTIKKIVIPNTNRVYFKTYSLERLENRDKLQDRLYEAWVR